MSASETSGTNERFIKPVREYQNKREQDRKERDDARTFATRLFIITVVALIVAGALGIGGLISIAMLRTGGKDRNWGIPVNSSNVQQGAAFQLQQLQPGTNDDLAARLADWVGNAFFVSSERSTETPMLGRTYAYLDGTALKKYNNYLDQNNGAYSPFTIGATRSVGIRVLKYPTLLPGSTDTWDVVWQESLYQQPGSRLLQQLNCELYLKVGAFRSVPTSKYDPDGTLFHQFNPHGYAIVDFTSVHTVGIDSDDCGLGAI